MEGIDSTLCSPDRNIRTLIRSIFHDSLFFQSWKSCNPLNHGSDNQVHRMHHAASPVQTSFKRDSMEFFNVGCRVKRIANYEKELVIEPR